MKKTILIFGAFALFALNVSAVEVQKKRDKWRFGYGEVTQKKIGTIDEETGVITITSIEVTCVGDGETKCRANSNMVIPELADLPEYTEAEGIVAQVVLDEGDEDIDSGVASGVVSTTEIFTNVSTGQSYSRTFTYTWSTNPDLSVESSLEISDPIYL